MEKEKFHIIELPRPEITISEFGMSELLGGILCTNYTICVTVDRDDKYNGMDQCSVPTYNAALDCHGNPAGCEGSMFCENYMQPCVGVLMNNSCRNYCGEHFN